MGQGEFLLFEPVKLWSPSPAMLCPQTRNAISLGSIFGYEALDLSPLGPWVRLAWPNSDSNPCLELASQYAHQSMVAFQHSHSEESLKRASRTGLAALQSLQSGIESCQDDRDKESLVIAVMLHYAAEVSCPIAWHLRRDADCFRPALPRNCILALHTASPRSVPPVEIFFQEQT